MRQTVEAALAAAFSLLAATESHAVFHLNLIDEVMSGVGGDATVQYVEVRVLSFQTVVKDSRLTAFNCDGTTHNVLLVVSADVANGGNGARFVMASSNFAAAAGITPDFTWDPSMTGNIDPTCGMVCWGAPGFAPPAPGSWDASDPNQYVDCVAYGGYTGPTKTSTHNSTPTSGTPTSLAPGDGTRSLTRGSTTGNNTADFALACPSATNNAGATANFGPCSGPSTTTTTTTLPALPLTPLSGGGSRKTDCYGEWRVAGGTGKSTVRCRNGDSCDGADEADNCYFVAQLCFDETKSKCSAAPVTHFKAATKTVETVDGENLDAIIAAVLGLGGQAAGEHEVNFATPPPAGACTAPFAVEVPLKMKRGKSKKGMRTILTESTAGGKVDKDKLKLICTP